MKEQIVIQSAEDLLKSASNKNPQFIQSIGKLQIRMDQLELAIDLMRPFETDEIKDLRIKIFLRLQLINERIYELMNRSEIRSNA